MLDMRIMQSPLGNQVESSPFGLYPRRGAAWHALCVRPAQEVLVMIPVAAAMSASIPLPVDLAPGMAPLLVLLAILALGLVEMTRALASERTARRSRSRPGRPVIAAISRLRAEPMRRVAA